MKVNFPVSDQKISLYGPKTRWVSLEEWLTDCDVNTDLKICSRRLCSSESREFHLCAAMAVDVHPDLRSREEYMQEGEAFVLAHNDTTVHLVLPKSLLVSISIQEPVVGKAVDCTVCGMQKKPVGRSAPAASAADYCSYECKGYLQDPQPGSLWPGEEKEEE